MLSLLPVLASSIRLPAARGLLTRRSLLGVGTLCSQAIITPPSSLAAPPTPLCDPDVVVLRTARNKQIVIVGTAHVSAESVALVRKVIRDVRPSTVMVELDKPRALTLMRKARARRTEGNTVTPTTTAGETGPGIPSFYRSLEKMGFESGEEFVAAIEEASRLNASVLLGDRDIQITMQRLKEADAEVARLRRMGALPTVDAARNRSLPNGRFDSETTRDQVQQMTRELLQPDNVRAMREYMKEQAPPIYDVLIAERDTYMAHALRDASGDSVVGVVGLAHLDGIADALRIEEGARRSSLMNC